MVTAAATHSSCHSAGVRVSLEARDVLLFGDLYRHRVLSVLWLARVRFGGSVRAARERLRKLKLTGYVEQVRLTRGEYLGYRLSAKGRRALGITKRPRPRAESGLFWHAAHAMTVAELADFVGRRVPAGWGLTWLTEQELCDGAAADWLPAGGMPDGVLELRNSAGELHRMAIEVELHEKQPGRYVSRLAWYKALLAGGALERVRWYVPSHRVGDAVGRALAAAGIAVGTQAEVRLIDQAAVLVYGSARTVQAAYATDAGESSPTGATGSS